MNSLYVGQVPMKPLTITVTDAEGAAVDLSGYTDTVVAMVDPSGAPVPLDGNVLLDEGAVGVIKYAFTATSPFTSPGDYRVQVRLGTDAGVLDFTSVNTIEVFKPLEVAP